MSYNYQKLPHSGIQSLCPYIPGKSIEELAREQGLSNIIKLASNENPLGCSPLVQEALAKLSSVQIASYPSPSNHPFLHKLSQHLRVSEDRLALGNGSDLLFTILLTCFALHKKKHILTHQYAFITYNIQAQTLGIPVSIAPLQANWQVDIDGLIKATSDETAIIFLANPNNPTGILIPVEEIERLLANISPSTLLVLDEAYYEYAFTQQDRRSIDLITTYSNLVITRTFSKAYGLAGLRLGYAIANPIITELLHRVQLPFVVNQAAMHAGAAALDDTDFLAKTLEVNGAGVKQIQHGLDAIKLNYLPTHCNFITIDCQKETTAIYQYLLQQGIIVRPLHPYGLPNHLRVSIGKKEQNERFLDKFVNCFI